jgi:hypothetical protein
VIDKVLQFVADVLYETSEILGEAAEYVETWLDPLPEPLFRNLPELTWEVGPWVRTDAERRLGL